MSSTEFPYILPKGSLMPVIPSRLCGHKVSGRVRHAMHKETMMEAFVLQEYDEWLADHLEELVGR